MTGKMRIVIAEDHTIVRQGLKALLENCDDIEVVCMAEDGLDAIRCINQHEPDLVLLDLNMPRMDGISVIREVVGINGEIKILVLTMYKDEDYIINAFEAGAHGYCLKSSGQEELLMAIRSVMDGKIFVSPDISGKVLEGYLSDRIRVREKSTFHALTQREKEVLKLVGEGYQNKEIAEYLCISVKTVEKHRANIMDKLDLHNAAALTAYAIEKGLVSK
ncbi:MAG: response regulator transcription factor [Deltaproteobacteria bacterium]|nr:response regulator transcription factor [Deltaproteobacteria bacterium]